MTIEIGSLIVGMSANLARLRTDMNNAIGIVSSSMNTMSNSIKDISSRMKLIVGSQVFQSLDLLARRGMEAFSATKHSAIDAADEFNKLSQKPASAQNHYRASNTQRNLQTSAWKD